MRRNGESGILLPAKQIRRSRRSLRLITCIPNCRQTSDRGRLAMKVFYDSIYNTKELMCDNRSLLEYISHKKTDKKQNLFDSLVGIDSARLSFYRENKKDSRMLLDTINFFEGVAGYNGDGYFHLGDEHGQVIPGEAIPRIKTESLTELKATGNKLCLSSKSYVRYTSKGGTVYPCAFSGRSLGLAFTESMLGNYKRDADYKEMFRTMAIIGDLIRHGINGLYDVPRKDVKNAFANVGIKPGKFTISVDGEDRVYYMAEDGRVRTEKQALALVERYNRLTYLHNHAVGDEVTVFGRKYKIDETGHIHVPTEDFWESGEINTR